MKFEFINVTADTRTIFPRLKINFEIFNDEDDEFTFLNFSGEMSEAETNKIFGKLTPDDFSTNLGKKDSINILMNLDIDIHKINAIEEIRKGKDLWIKLFIRPVLCRIRADRAFDITNIRTNGYWVQDKVHADKIKIPKSEWIKILEDLNYGNYRIFEIPLSTFAEDITLDKAIEHLENAQQKFDSGEYDDVLVDCRDSIEEIHSVLQSINKNDRSLREKFTSILGSEKENRIEKLRINFKLFSDLGGHKVIPEVKVIDRFDAELAMNFAHDLVKYYAKRMQQAKSSE